MALVGRSGKAWRTWDDMVGLAPWNQAFDQLRLAEDRDIREACGDADAEAWNVELGPLNREMISRGIKERLGSRAGNARQPSNAVLIGGPPCQAYSVVGRSRNRGTEGYRAEMDHRHFLYLEYLQVINEFRPAVFVMENVKGILTSRVSERQIFQTIMEDLRRPDIACGTSEQLEYVLVALPSGSSTGNGSPDPEDFIVHAEHFGIPQARHRVIICGIRRDVYDSAGSVRSLKSAAAVSVGQVIDDLPPLRPQLSFRGNGMRWVESLDLPLMDAAVAELASDPADRGRVRVAHSMQRIRSRLQGKKDPGHGADRIDFRYSPLGCGNRLAAFYRDRPLSLLANHESKAHMPADIVRYLFVSAYGREMGSSPNLSDFPPALLPDHKNVDRESPGNSIFKDRFRVQLADRQSMTVTSHIAKDGHAFIHPDPVQCRSLTVREAARLQTFPDSYVFLGSRTSQYTQVGNAVPPFLALQIADIVGEILTAAGMN